MCDRFDEHPAFEKLGTTTWLAENPLSVPTEREIATQNKGEPVYRALFRKLESEILGVNELKPCLKVVN
jgi:tRNA (guanine-N7-)-methyltransferase